MPTSHAHTTKPSTEMTEDTKSVITVLLLLTVTPIGIVLMWVWTKWQTWVKALITGCTCLPMILFVIIMAIVIVAAESDKNNHPGAPKPTWNTSSSSNNYQLEDINVSNVTVNNLVTSTDLSVGYSVSYSKDSLLNCIEGPFSKTLTLYAPENIEACSYDPSLPYAVRISTVRMRDEYQPFSQNSVKDTIMLDGMSADRYVYGDQTIIMAESPSSHKIVVIEVNYDASVDQEVLEAFLANFKWTGRE
jgi:hypothetical protein